MRPIKHGKKPDEIGAVTKPPTNEAFWTVARQPRFSSSNSLLSIHFNVSMVDLIAL